MAISNVQHLIRNIQVLLFTCLSLIECSYIQEFRYIGNGNTHSTPSMNQETEHTKEVVSANKQQQVFIRVFTAVLIDLGSTVWL
jgi:hypothetical protein